jgi:hypothetical protein
MDGMIGEGKPTGRRVALLALAVFAISLGLLPSGAKAQEAPQAPQAPPAAATPATAAAEEASPVDRDEPSTAPEEALSAQELQALVAPIALYPDLVLVLTLQASLAPLDIVRAERFLADHAKDPSLKPDPDWDQSVIGLLNYPTVIHKMSADLDWTQTLGQAVLNQLEGVQDAIQDVRGFMRAVGGLESNDKMTVVVENDDISIRPTDPDAVFIPQYDPDALLTALYSTDVTPAAAGPSAEGAEAVGAEANAAAAPGEPAATPGATGEPAAAAPAAVPAAAPAYPPGYYPPPPMTYSDPWPSWVGTAATFAGGAVVGGLVGWAIADDDDGDHDGDGNDVSRGNVNIEDSNITVNRGGAGAGNAENAKLRAENARLERQARVDEQREQTKRELNQKYAQQRSAAAPARTSKSSGLATSRTRPPAAATTRQAPGGKELTGRVQQAETKATRGRTAQAQPAGASRLSAARAGDRQQAQATSAFGGTKSATQAKRDSDRGLKSRSGATTVVKPNRGGGSSNVFAQRGGGGSAAGGGRQRGNQSRGGRR